MNTKQPAPHKSFSYAAFAVASVAGMLAAAVLLAHLAIPIPGTAAVTDGRELFVTIGAALSGPLGGVLIGLLAGVAAPGGRAWASMLAHVAGAVWIGVAYKQFVHKCPRAPLRLLAWAALVFSYYYALLMPVFLLGQMLFNRQTISFPQMYASLARGALPEAILTTLITTTLMYVLPKKYRQPLW